MIYDVFTYNGEREVLKIHLNILSKYVDRFIIVEANQTFTGHPKPLYFFRDQRYFKPFWSKIDYFVVNDWEDEALWEMAKQSPNTRGAHHWSREFYIKESIKKALISSGVQDDDLLLIGDADEVVDVRTLPETNDNPFPMKAKLQVYAYYLNNKSSEEFFGTLIAPYKQIKDECLNHLRSNSFKNPTIKGWHFTSMGGLKEIQRKLNDSYTTESYNTSEVQQLLPERYRNGVDYLGRDFKFNINELEWPNYLKENKKLFHNLLWQEN